ncbi:MAG: methyltransferase domain-containing protein [Chloroflexi bacterium]|nr:methyltransferase domain-containing protein [Chloroflexota bacterium]
MLMYGWMVFVEHAPERYDWAVKVMTAGTLDRIKDRIAETVARGERALDLGCGTGTLAVRCMKRGAQVTGLDSSAFMLEQARKNAVREGLAGQQVLIRDSVTQLRKHFAEASLDTVMSTMTLGEFPREYLQFILRESRRILRPGGRLIVADEVWPEKALPRLLFRLMMVLFWIPQFLLLRRVFFPIESLRGVIEEAGFRILDVETWPGTSFQLVFAEKTDQDEPPISGPANSLSGTTSARAVCPWSGIGGHLRELFHIFFRHINFPCTLGLIRVGNPDDTSPVFLSGNYVLTVMRLLRALEGTHSYLLVANSRGSNVWCAAGMNEFSEHDVVDAINVADLGKIVRHRSLIAPPYAAVGVDTRVVKSETGFHIKWGPSHLNDIPRYVENGFRRTNDMLQVQFGLQDRLEQALSTAWANCMTVALVALIWPREVLATIGLIFAVYLYSFGFWNMLPKEDRWRRTSVMAVTLSAGVMVTALLLGWEMHGLLLSEAILLAVVTVVAADICGSSPLYKSTLTHWLRNGDYRCQFSPVVDPSQCTNCQSCLLVCPRNVFAARRNGSKHVVVVRPQDCIECLACVKQCHYGAILNRSGRYKGDVKSIANLHFLLTRDSSYLKHEDRWLGHNTTIRSGLTVLKKPLDERGTPVPV